MTALPVAQRLGLGTYRLGARTYEVCRAALDLGYRHIDTAVLYENEDAVARAVARSGIAREEIFVVTKIHVRDIRAEGRILPAARESLERLGRIDLLLLHAPVGDWRRRWEELQEAATWHDVGAVGVSNFDRAQLESLAAPLPSWNQIEASPFLPRRELAAWCREKGIALVAHSPLTKRARLGDAVLNEVAARRGVTPAQVLTAWSLAQGFAVLPRTSNLQHLAENLAAGDLALDAGDLEKLATLEDGYATHPQHARDPTAP